MAFGIQGEKGVSGAAEFLGNLKDFREHPALPAALYSLKGIRDSRSFGVASFYITYFVPTIVLIFECHLCLARQPLQPLRPVHLAMPSCRPFVVGRIAVAVGQGPSELKA